MNQDSPKNWWQTAAGVMTGLAALLTAIAGLILALAQTGFIDRSGSEKVADGSKQIDRQNLDSPAAPSLNTSRVAGQSKSVRPGVVLPTVTDSPRFEISLPEKREYVLGPETVKARYILTSATVSRASQESIKLSIKVHFVADGVRRTNSSFLSSQFTLAIEDTEIDAEPPFSELVRVGDSIDRYINFTAPANTTEVVLRIKVGHNSHAEIPLTLAPTDGSGRTTAQREPQE